MLNKKIKAIIFLLAFLWLIIIPAIDICAAQGETFKLTVIHINDTHGRTEAEPYISTLAKDLKAKGENVLLLDAGDRLHGQITTNLSRGESVVKIMNEVGYSAMVPGNHDFNFGIERLKELSDLMNFPLLSANVLDINSSNLFPPYTIFDFDGTYIGVFGIATPEILEKSDPRIVSGLIFDNPTRTARAMVAELQTQGCDLIIALAYMGLDSIPDINTFGIDVIIDGHMTKDDSLVAQTGFYGQHIGIVEIELSDGNVSKIARTVSVPKENEVAELLPDKNIIAKIAEEEAKVEPITSVVVGKTPILLNGEKDQVRTKETNLTNLITDSMCWATGAYMSFIDGGNIRASIEAGDITMGQILAALPFSSSIVTIELRGADLLEALEYGVCSYPNPVGQFIQVSGINFEFDPTAKPMRRGTKVAMANGETFDINKIYTVATIDFLAGGGDGYAMILKGSNVVYFQSNAEALAQYLATDPEIKEEPENRIKAIDSKR